jgi:hypothetical protein
MSIKPAIPALRSLHKFSNQPGWDEIDKLFQAELSKAYEFLAESRDDVALRQTQGRVQFIRDFQALVRDAPKLLEKLKDSTL